MDPRRLTESRTFRYSDGESTAGYQAVDITREGLTWFRWSHQHGEGRIDEGAQTLEAFLAEGPLHPVPANVLDQLRALARSWSS